MTKLRNIKIQNPEENFNKVFRIEIGQIFGDYANGQTIDIIDFDDFEDMWLAKFSNSGTSLITGLELIKMQVDGDIAKIN